MDKHDSEYVIIGTFKLTYINTILGFFHYLRKPKSNPTSNIKYYSLEGFLLEKASPDIHHK
jgi:hypothetical protein